MSINALQPPPRTLDPEQLRRWYEDIYNKSKDTSNGLNDHLADLSNPHEVTKTQVGLSNVTNVAQMPLSYLDTDTTLTANSDVKVPSQKAIKTYVDTSITSSKFTYKISFLASLNEFFNWTLSQVSINASGQLEVSEM